MNSENIGQQIATAFIECNTEDLWTWIYVMESAITTLGVAIAYLFHRLMQCMKSNREPWNQIERRTE